MIRLSLKGFLEDGEDLSAGTIEVPFTGMPSPKVVDVLKRLDRLDLLSGEVILALLGQAPIDPLGVYGALKHTGVWAFSSLDCTMIQVLAKKKDTPVALMRIDLLSNDIIFVALQNKQLVEIATITATQMEDKLREEGMTEGRIMDWLKRYINDTVATGLAA